MSNLSRRQFLFTAGATTAATLLANGCSNSSNSTSSKTASPVAPSPVNATDIPEVTTAKLG